MIISESPGVNAVGVAGVADLCLNLEAALRVLEPLLDRAGREKLEHATSVVSELRETARSARPSDRDVIEIAGALVAVGEAEHHIEAVQDVLRIGGTFSEDLNELGVWLRRDVYPALSARAYKVADNIDEAARLSE